MRKKQKAADVCVSARIYQIYFNSFTRVPRPSSRLTSRFQSPPSISLGKLGQQIFQSPFPLPSRKLIPRAATQKSTARFVTPTRGGAGVREVRTSRVAVGK